MRTFDGLLVLLPNAQVLQNPLTNFTHFENRRTDFTIGVAYGTDLDEARRVAMEAVASCDGVDESPAPEAWVEELAASWVTIRVRYWHSPRVADMWQVRSSAITAVYKSTEQHGIDMPFEQKAIMLSTPDGPLGVDNDRTQDSIAVSESS